MRKTTLFLSAVIVLAALSPALAPGPALAQPGIWGSGNGSSRSTPTGPGSATCSRSIPRA